jgi:hypothetical protein
MNDMDKLIADTREQGEAQLAEMQAGFKLPPSDPDRLAEFQRIFAEQEQTP